MPYQKGANYAKSEIVNIKNKNLKQYFRNISGVTIPYMRSVDIDNPFIPFAIYEENTNKWFYPVYKQNITGTTLRVINGKNVYVKEELFVFRNRPGTGKTENKSTYIDYTSSKSTLETLLLGFKSVSETVYPEDNFAIYDPEAVYQTGDIVKSDGLLYKSLININTNQNLLDPTAWKVDDLSQQMISSSGDQFYSFFKQDKNFSSVIRDIKNLDNQNLPALIKYNFDTNGNAVGENINQVERSNEYEFCPNPCTYYDLTENYNDTFIKVLLLIICHNTSILLI